MSLDAINFLRLFFLFQYFSSDINSLQLIYKRSSETCTKCTECGYTSNNNRKYEKNKRFINALDCSHTIVNWCICYLKRNHVPHANENCMKRISQLSFFLLWQKLLAINCDRIFSVTFRYPSWNFHRHSWLEHRWFCAICRRANCTRFREKPEPVRLEY